jgi:hypothetical protein
VVSLLLAEAAELKSADVEAAVSGQVLHGVFVIILYPPLPVRYVTHIPGVSYREGGAYITGRSRR